MQYVQKNSHNDNESCERRPFTHNNVNLVGIIGTTESAGATSLG